MNIIDDATHIMPRIVMIVGPTGIGKSNVSIKIAKKINGEIISMDSMQIYKGMDIGTGKIKEAETDGIKHYLIDIIEPSQTFSVSQFVEQASECVTKITNEGKIPIFVGGTGLYINAFINGHNFAETAPNDIIRKKYAALAEEKGNSYLHNLLQSVDSLSAEKISIKDTKRIIRALEIYEQTGVPKSSKAECFKNEINYKMFVLNTDRKELYDKINSRVDKMFADGLIDEVKSFIQYKDMQAMQAIGYKEVISMLDNNLSLKETIEKVKQNSRHYAKRQLTYFRWINAEKIWINDDFEQNILSNLLI